MRYKTLKFLIDGYDVSCKLEEITLDTTSWKLHIPPSPVITAPRLHKPTENTQTSSVETQSEPGNDNHDNEFIAFTHPNDQLFPTLTKMTLLEEKSWMF